MALAEKGIPVSCHPGLDIGDRGQPPASVAGVETTTVNNPPQEQAVNQSSTMTSSTIGSHDVVIDEDGGIDL